MTENNRASASISINNYQAIRLRSAQVDLSPRSAAVSNKQDQSKVFCTAELQTGVCYNQTFDNINLSICELLTEKLT